MAALLATCVLGCGRSDLPPLGEVRGELRLDGAPVPKAIVSLTPVSGGRPSRAITDESGKFELGTFEPGDGALVGEHRVAINPLDPVPPSFLLNPKAPTTYKPPFPPEYWSPDKSGLTLTVTADGVDDLVLEMTSAPKGTKPK
jgi:hypothetical protein